MSLVTSPYTIPAAFVAAEQGVHPNGQWVVGSDRRWNSVNEQQRRYLEIFEIARTGLEESGKELGIGRTKTMCVLLTVRDEVSRDHSRHTGTAAVGGG